MANILVVEDHPLMRPTLRDILMLEGHAVLTATQGQEALEILRRHHEIELIITDCVMPVLDGIELVRRIRTIPHYARLPVLVFTADNRSEVRSRALAAGADMFLVRPITVPDLVRAVNHLLAHRQEQS